MLFEIIFVYLHHRLLAQQWAVGGLSDHKCSNGSRFEGYFKNGIIDGTGIFYWNNFHYYVGHWLVGKRSGYSIKFFENGTYLVRYFEKEKLVSRIITNMHTFKTGTGIYQGEMAYGNALGKGTFR